MIDPLHPSVRYSCITPNLDRHIRVRHQQRGEEYCILDDGIRIHFCLALVRVVAEDAAGGAAGGGRETVPELHLVAGDGEGDPLIGRDVVGEEVTPGVMRHVGDVGGGAGGDFGGAGGRGADVVGFAVVVPGYDSGLGLGW